LSVWGCLGFYFIEPAAIGKLLVPGNIEKFTFFAVHPKTLTSIYSRPKNVESQKNNVPHKVGHYLNLGGPGRSRPPGPQ